MRVWPIVRNRSASAGRLGAHGFLVALLAFLAVALELAASAAAQGAVKSTFGDWQMRCETPAGAKTEQCALVQSVQAEDKPNVTLVVIVLKTADGRSRLLRVIAPLGVLLPSGLGLKIDNDVGRAGFVRCLPSGCVAEVVMDDDLLAKLARRPGRDLHRVPDPGGGHRHPGLAERVRRRRSKAFPESDAPRRAPSGRRFRLLVSDRPQACTAERLHSGPYSRPFDCPAIRPA